MLFSCSQKGSNFFKVEDLIHCLVKMNTNIMNKQMITVTSPANSCDLHCHTSYSDGVLLPQALIDRALNNGVTALAITDHDTLDGLESAHRYIIEANKPITLINGIELSVNWHNFDIHIVGLNFDPANHFLLNLVEQQRYNRLERAKRIAEKLDRLFQTEQTLQHVIEIAGTTNITRAHLAHFLVAQGKVKNSDSAFKKYLGKNKLAYVSPMWCTIQEAVSVIHQAEGRAILAHPLRYDLSGKWLIKLFTEFKDAGGDAIEVLQSRQTPDQTQRLIKYAGDYGFLASKGSDFHQPFQWLDIGQLPSIPQQVIPVWHDWPLDCK